MNALYDFTNVKTDIAAVKVIDPPAVIFEKCFL
jgi:hypothetical protein